MIFFETMIFFRNFDILKKNTFFDTGITPTVFVRFFFFCSLFQSTSNDPVYKVIEAVFFTYCFFPNINGIEKMTNFPKNSKIFIKILRSIFKNSVLINEKVSTLSSFIEMDFLKIDLKTF